MRSDEKYQCAVNNGPNAENSIHTYVDTNECLRHLNPFAILAKLSINSVQCAPLITQERRDDASNSNNIAYLILIYFNNVTGASHDNGYIACPIVEIQRYFARFIGRELQPYNQGKFDGEQRTINGEVNYQVETDLKADQGKLSNGTLDRMQQERQLKLEDPKAQTPVTEAMDRLEPTRSMKLTDASIDIKQWIHEGTFVDSKKTESGTSLRYEMPLESMLDGNIKKYVKKFESELIIYVSNAGIPTSAKMTMSGKGSAFIFFTMKASSESFYEFDVVGDRLIQTKVEQHWKHDSTFSKGDTRISIVAAAQ